MPTRRTRATPDTPAESSDESAVTQLAPGGRLIRFADSLPEAEEETDPAELLALEMRSVLEGSQGDNVRGALYRTNAFSRKLEWCADYTPEQVLDGSIQSLIARQFGAGDYEVRILNRKGVRGRYQFSIAEQHRANDTTAAPVPAPHAGPDPVLMQVLQGVVEGQRAIAAALAQRPDPQAEMDRSLTMMIRMREAMGLNQAPAAVAAPVDPMATLERSLALVARLREASGELAPKEPDPDNPMSLALAGLDVVKTLLNRNAGAPLLASAGNNDAPPIALPGSVAQAAPDDDAGPEEGDPLEAMRVQGIMIAVETGARNQRPPADMARYLFEVAPGEWLPMLKLPNWLELFGQLAPELARDHAQWLTLVRDEVLKLDGAA